MSPKYQNPPIVEAVCEFKFDPSSTWDSAILGLVYSHVRDKFPIREEELGLEFGIDAVSVQPVRAVKKLSKMKFWSEDRKSLLQVGMNLLVINVLSPYPSWRVFYPLINESLNIYQRIAQPKKITKIGLRYINKIPLRKKPEEVADYFNIYPVWNFGPDIEYRVFIAGTRLKYNSGEDELKVELLVNELPENKGVSAQLDLDYYTTIAKINGEREAMVWVENAHKHIEEIFEASVAEELKKTFEIIKE